MCSFEGFQFGTKRAISAPESEDPDREVAQPLRGIGVYIKWYQSLSFSSVDFRQRRKRRRQRTQICTLCVTDSRHNAAKKTRAAFIQPCCREGDVRASHPIGNNGSSIEKST
jgi:hypothetical protein